jgi:hypothetical protein
MLICALSAGISTYIKRQLGLSIYSGRIASLQEVSRIDEPYIASPQLISLGFQATL